MPDKTFAPYSPEKKILVELTMREAHLVKQMRLIDFGHVTVFKANYQLLRIEANKSIILNEIEGKELEYKFDNGVENK